MRFATLQTAAGARVVLRDGNDYIDLHATEPALPGTLREILAAGKELHSKLSHITKASSAIRIPVASAQYLPPIPNPSKVLCIGLNYADHAAEQNVPIPREPVVFGKFNNALAAHGQNIALPKVCKKVDFEAELVAVVGKGGRYISEADATQHVAGYMVGQDVSGRDWQQEKDGKQWLCGKSFDHFAPTGPELVTADEVPNPQGLAIQLRLNGQVMQDSSTSQLIFSIPKLIAYVSQVFTLEAGDLIFTGTPPGVGFARKPPVWIQPNDVTEVEIAGLGVLRNRFVAE